MPLILVFEKLKQEDCCKFKASLGCIEVLEKFGLQNQTVSKTQVKLSGNSRKIYLNTSVEQPLKKIEQEGIFI